MKTEIAARVEPKRPPPAAVQVSPAEVMRQMSRFVKAVAWRDAVAYYDQHAASVVERLSHAQRLCLEEIMHVADTVVEFAPGETEAASEQRGPGQ